MEQMEATDNKLAILDLEGATCTSCIITIEHLGRRMDGVSDVYVDRGTSTIQVEYDGNQESLEKLCNLVDKIGYHAEIRTTE
jgi:copper chaperone CopZ